MRIFARVLLCISKASRSCNRTYVKEVKAIASGFPIRHALDCIIDAQSASVCFNLGINLGTDEVVTCAWRNCKIPGGPEMRPVSKW